VACDIVLPYRSHFPDGVGNRGGRFGRRTKGKKTLMDLRLEFFVEELERSIRFYTQVLGFQVRQRGIGGYTMLTNETATISLNLRASLPNDHPVHCRPGEKVGRGVEVVLSVEDINACHDAVEASGWPLSSNLTSQPWGLTDFRLVDPDGYYIRVTSKRRTQA
jgi:predicted enzyme related to lactoylglutathione lyase